MDTRQIKFLLLFGLAVYVLGLISFLAGSGNDVESEPLDVERIDRLLSRRFNQSQYDKMDIRDKIMPITKSRGSENDTRQFHPKHGKKSRRRISSKERRFHFKQTNGILHQSEITQPKIKSRYNNALLNDPDFALMNNMTFKEKADYILHMLKSSNKSAKHNQKVRLKQSKHLSDKEYFRENVQFSNIKTDSTLTTTNSAFMQIAEDIFLFSSFYDDRQTIPYIRNVIIARSSKHIFVELWCHFNDRNSKKLIGSEVEFYETCENHLKVYAAYIGSCNVPADTHFEKIYITTNKNENNKRRLVPVTVIRETRKSFKNDLAVCVPPLFGTVNPLRLLEFIEFSIILGYKHFTFYSHKASSDILRILNHYKKYGLVTLIDWPLPVENAAIWYHGQSASVWDCLYRNMYVFKHVAFVDIDELIFPRNYETLTDFIKHQTREYYTLKSETEGDLCAFRFESAYFDPLQHIMISNIFDLADNVENYLVTLNSIYRKEDFSKVRTKMIIEPLKIFEIGIHHVSKPMRENFYVQNIKPNVAYIHHYRTCENNYGVRCVGKVADNQARQYRHRLLTRLKWRFYHLFKEILLN